MQEKKPRYEEKKYIDNEQINDYLKKKLTLFGGNGKVDPKAIEIEQIKDLNRYEQKVKIEAIESHFLKNNLDSQFITKLRLLEGTNHFDVTKNTFLTGSFGSGKTVSVLRSVYDLLNEMTLLERSRFTFIYTVFLDIFAMRYDDSKRVDYQKLKTVQLLIIDEFATIKTSDREDFNQVFHDIVDSRLLRDKPTFLITNVRKEYLLTKLEPSLVSRLALFKEEKLEGVDKRQSHRI